MKIITPSYTIQRPCALDAGAGRFAAAVFANALALFAVVYGVIRAAAQSGCHAAFLIEHGFHTNPEDSAFLQDEQCLTRLAAAEADVIARIFGADAL